MSKAAEVYVGGGWYKKGKNFSPYDLERAAAAYASKPAAHILNALEVRGGGGVVYALLACGGPRVELYGTAARGVVVVSFGYQSYAAYVPVAEWENVVENCFPLVLS